MQLYALYSKYTKKDVLFNREQWKSWTYLTTNQSMEIMDISDNQSIRSQGKKTFKCTYRNPSPGYDVTFSFLITFKKSTFSKIIYLFKNPRSTEYYYFNMYYIIY